jgi:hypothetical protein
MLFRIMLYREKLTISTQFGFLPTGYSFSFESLPVALSIAGWWRVRREEFSVTGPTGDADL